MWFMSQCNFVILVIHVCMLKVCPFVLMTKQKKLYTKFKSTYPLKGLKLVLLIILLALP